jgi:pseudaminic acid biosynthesis-associated methylase
MVNSDFSTDQEAFWAGDFGDQYLARNTGQHLVSANLALFSRILSRASAVTSILELGANIGNNLQALRQLLPGVKLSAVEINAKAAEQLAKIPDVKVMNQSLLEFEPNQTHDMSLSKGVLIHIAPQRLPDAYDRLYRASHRYVCLVEYYNPTPVAVPYRGNDDRLYKRDFAGEMLDRYPDLELVDYGFSYHRDRNFPQDDANWFLLEKKGR